MGDTDSDNGVHMDLISKSRIENATTREKINTILNSVKDGKIVVLEARLTPEEESKLVEETMNQIQPDGFDGIKIESNTSPAEGADSGGLFGSISKKLKGDPEDGSPMIIGPSDKIETLYQDDELLSTRLSG